jgi:type VI secretion system protein ImpE
MTANELVKKGNLKEALATLKAQVREKPEDPALRVFLFQLDCVIGDIDKALTQLQVLSNMTADAMFMAQIFRPIVACELLRREVFAGRKTPLIFGEPDEWIGFLVQANEMAGRGEHAAASRLRDKAFENAPGSAGMMNGVAFEWIADADSRLGPALEAIIDGKYYWVPFNRIKSFAVVEPSDLRDLVWAPAQFVWANGGETAGHIPVRYINSEASKDDTIRLARCTEWTEPSPGYSIGLGQRILTTDQGDFPILECRKVEMVLEKAMAAN